MHSPSQFQAQASSPGVVVTDFDIPFWSMVRFTTKLALACAPAMLILSLMAAAGVTLIVVVFNFISRVASALSALP